MSVDTATGTKYTKYVKKLVQIKACGSYCVLATRTDEPNVMLCSCSFAPPYMYRNM